MPSARHRQRSQRGSGTSSARTGGSSARTGASSARTGASSVDRRAQSVDYELAKLIVTEAEAQWERARNGGKPMPLTLVLQTHKEVLRSRGDDPVRDDHSVYQLLIKLQAERPEFRWQDKLAAARKADSAKRRRGRAKTASKAAAASEQQRNQAALAELAKAPSALPSRLGTEEWIAWRQWRAYVQYQKQLRSSASRKRDGSHYVYKEPVSLEPELTQAVGELAGGATKREISRHKEPERLERSLESELIQAADELDGSKLDPSMASGAMPASVVASVSPSNIARTNSHALVEHLEKGVHTGTRVSAPLSQSAPTAGSGHLTSPSRRPHGGAGSQSYRLLRRCWRVWRDWLYYVALEQLALIESPEPPVGIAAGPASPARAAARINIASNDPAPFVESRAENKPQPSSDHWDAVNENLRRCGRRRSHNYKATSHAHFLMRRARTRSTSEAELMSSLR